MAGAAALVLTILGFRGDVGDTQVSAAGMRTLGGETVGHAFVHDGEHPFVLLDLPAWSDLAAAYGTSTGPYWLDVETDEGTTEHNQDRP